MGVNELSALIWRERELLELLLFKLEEEQLLLTAGKSRWLQHATREVEQVMVRLRTAGLARAVEVSVVASEWGTAEDSSLSELADNAPAGPWSDIFAAHLQAMADLARQVAHVRELNEQFLRTASRSTQETLSTLDQYAGTYGASGSSDMYGSRARLFDQSA